MVIRICDICGCEFEYEAPFGIVHTSLAQQGNTYNYKEPYRMELCEDCYGKMTKKLYAMLAKGKIE